MAQIPVRGSYNDDGTHAALMNIWRFLLLNPVKESKSRFSSSVCVDNYRRKPYISQIERTSGRSYSDKVFIYFPEELLRLR